VTDGQDFSFIDSKYTHLGQDESLKSIARKQLVDFRGGCMA